MAAQANQICATASKVTNAAAKDALGRNPSPEDFLAFYKATLIPSVIDQVNQIKALGIPAGEEAQVNAIFTAVDSALSRTQQRVDSGTVPKGNPFAEVDKLTKSYGWTACSKG